ncbi:MAG: DUF2934 domain-containing protein [Roseiarcus sp.]|jgi:hypothetical protein
MSGIQELVRERAYELWQRAGAPEGRSDEFWFAAEHELEDKTATAVGEACSLVPPVEEPPADAFFLEGPANIPSRIIH